MGPRYNVEAQRVIIGLLKKPHSHVKARMPGPGARSIPGSCKTERKREGEAAQRNMVVLLTYSYILFHLSQSLGVF